MLQKLVSWLNEEDGATPASAGDEERRVDPRHEFTGAKLPVRLRRTFGILHLRDLSCEGASGITDLPLAVGAIIFLQFKRRRYRGAEVRWVRNTLVGLRFFRPLDPAFLEKFREREAQRRRAGRYST